MSSLSLVALLSGAFFWGSSGASATADADECDAATASDHFDEGLISSGVGEFEAAIASFEAAYRCKPSADVLYNISQAQIQLGRYQAAIDTLQRYLESGTLTPERRLAVKSQIDDLRKEVPAPAEAGPSTVGPATLQVQCDVPGATLFVDGSRVAAFPFEQPLELRSGEHLLRFHKDGFVSKPMHVYWSSGHSAQIACQFAPEASVSDSAGVTLPVDSSQPARTLALDGRPPSVASGGQSTASSLPLESVLLGGVALLAAGGATALYVWNEDRYQTWERTDDELMAARRQRLTRQQAEAFNELQLDNNERLDSIQGTNVVTVGLSLGAAAALLGAFYYALADSPESQATLALTQHEVLIRSSW